MARTKRQHQEQTITRVTAPVPPKITRAALRAFAPTLQQYVTQRSSVTELL